MALGPADSGTEPAVPETNHGSGAGTLQGDEWAAGCPLGDVEQWFVTTPQSVKPPIPSESARLPAPADSPSLVPPLALPPLDWPPAPVASPERKPHSVMASGEARSLQAVVSLLGFKEVRLPRHSAIGVAEPLSAAHSASCSIASAQALTFEALGASGRGMPCKQ